jgi:hypothetical protein
VKSIVLKPLTAQVVASAIGLALVVAIVVLGAYWMSSPEQFMTSAVLCDLVAIPFAIAAWTGVLWKRRSAEAEFAETWSSWIFMFFIGLAVSALFIFMDCAGHFPLTQQGVVCDGHPGFGVIFTVGAVALTVISLPSAVRAWVLGRLSKPRNQGASSEA